MLGAALIREAATDRVQVWLDQQDSAALMISDWVVTEFASAWSVKARIGKLRVEDRAKAASLFTRLRTESLTVVPVTCDNFVTAARFADQFGIGLRARDALHVDVAARQAATIRPLDKRLAEGTIALGVNADMVRHRRHRRLWMRTGLA